MKKPKLMEDHLKLMTNTRPQLNQTSILKINDKMQGLTNIKKLTQVQS